MKRFKLLKDLPGIDAGTPLWTKENYGKLLVKGQNYTTGFVVTEGGSLTTDSHVKFDDARLWLEELPEEFSRRVDEYCKFFSLQPSGGIAELIECGDSISNSAFAIGNYFKTRDEAEAVVDYLTALAIVRDDAKGFVPDWGDSEQKKFIVYFDATVHRLCEVDVFCLAHNGVFGLPYFATADDAKASIKKHKAQWLTIFGVKDETESDDE